MSLLCQYSFTDVTGTSFNEVELWAMLLCPNIYNTPRRCFNSLKSSPKKKQLSSFFQLLFKILELFKKENKKNTFLCLLKKSNHAIFFQTISFNQFHSIFDFTVHLHVYDRSTLYKPISLALCGRHAALNPLSPCMYFKYSNVFYI